MKTLSSFLTVLLCSLTVAACYVPVEPDVSETSAELNGAGRCSGPGAGWAGDDCVTDCDCCGLVCQKGTDRLGIYWSICNHCPAQGEEIDIPWP